MEYSYKFLTGLGLFIGIAIQPLSAQPISCADDETPTHVSGKIYNSAVQPGVTLGTVHLHLGAHKGEKHRMKCGILGQGATSPDGSANFIHTFVCDDQVIHPVSGESYHSQLTLNTSGFANFQACPAGYPPGSAYGTFEETSVPLPGTGRGIFENVERGEIHIKGTLNCLFAIDMKFKGEVCLKNS